MRKYMAPIRALIVAVALALPGSALAAISNTIIPSYDGIFYSAYPNGDKPVTPEAVCPTGWTCATKGTGTEDIDEVSSSSFFMVGEGNDDEGDLFYAYKSCGTSDCQIIARIHDDIAGYVENFTGFGIGFTESTDDAAWYVHNWEPFTNDAPRCKWGTPGPDDGNVAALTGARPEYLGLVHNDALDTISCWHSDDGSTWTQIGTDISRNVTEPLLAYVFGTSQEDGQTSSSTPTNIAFSTTVTIDGGGCEPDCPGDHDHLRDVFAKTDLETGAIQGIGNLVDGVYTDNPNVHQLKKSGTFTITDVTDNSATPIATYTGTPSEDEEGFRITSVTGGMQGLLDSMYRFEGVGGGDAQLWQDANDANKPYDGALCAPTTGANLCTGAGAVLPNDRVDTTGYGIWSPGDTATAQRYVQNTDTDGCCGPADSTAEAIRVVEAGHVPESNLNGAADPVDPLHGDFMLSARIWLEKPYDEMNNRGKNNQRNGWSWVHDAMDWGYNETIYYGWAVYLPSNYDSNTINAVSNGSVVDATFNNTDMMVFVTGEKNDFDDHIAGLHLAGGGTFDNWYVSYQKPDGNGYQNQFQFTSLGSVQPDIGHWTCFVAEWKFHLTDGIYKLWKQPSCETAESGEGLTLVFDYAGPLCKDSDGGGSGLTGPCNTTTFHAGGRQYKYSWNQKSTTTPSEVIEILYDDVFMGRGSLGQGFSDVHAHGASEP